MISFSPGKETVARVFDSLLGGVAPRPIALVSTISKDGIRNLSPFSFYNAFGGNPPTIAFSPSRRRRDNTTKDTYHNLIATEECVVQAVTYSIVQQVNLASGEFDADTDEFIRSGLTPIPSELVKPARVKESPFQMECRLKQMIALGDGPGSGNLAICEVIRFHVSEEIVDENGVIIPDRIDLVGRNSAHFYTRAHGPAIFEVATPLSKNIVGYDGLPGHVKESPILSANNLGRLGNVKAIPTVEEAKKLLAECKAVDIGQTAFANYQKNDDYRSMLAACISMARGQNAEAIEMFHSTAKVALKTDEVEFAWKVLVLSSLSNEELVNLQEKHS